MFRKYETRKYHMGHVFAYIDPTGEVRVHWRTVYKTQAEANQAMVAFVKRANEDLAKSQK